MPEVPGVPGAPGVPGVFCIFSLGTSDADVMATEVPLATEPLSSPLASRPPSPSELLPPGPQAPAPQALSPPSSYPPHPRAPPSPCPAPSCPVYPTSRAFLAPYRFFLGAILTCGARATPWCRVPGVPRRPVIGSLAPVRWQPWQASTCHQGLH